MGNGKMDVCAISDRGLENALNIGSGSSRGSDRPWIANLAVGLADAFINAGILSGKLYRNSHRCHACSHNAAAAERR